MVETCWNSKNDGNHIPQLVDVLSMISNLDEKKGSPTLIEESSHLVT